MSTGYVQYSLVGRTLAAIPKVLGSNLDTFSRSWRNYNRIRAFKYPEKREVHIIMTLKNVQHNINRDNL